MYGKKARASRVEKRDREREIKDKKRLPTCARDRETNICRRRERKSKTNRGTQREGRRGRKKYSRNADGREQPEE